MKFIDDENNENRLLSKYSLGQLDNIIRNNFVNCQMYQLIEGGTSIKIIFNETIKIYKIIINDNGDLEAYEVTSTGEKIGDCFILYSKPKTHYINDDFYDYNI
jgi:hypothetical protein